MSPPCSVLVGNSSGVLVLVLGAGQDRVGQSYIQVVVVLDQGDVFVVEHKILEGRVKVVGFCETITCDRLVDDAVLGIAVHTAKKPKQGHAKDIGMHSTQMCNCFSSYSPYKVSKTFQNPQNKMQN